MTYKVYEYDKCSTCKKALKYLDQRKISYEKISIVDRPPSLPELKKMLGFLGGDVRRLFNTSGLVYRELKLSEKLPSMGLDVALKLLAENGKLIKRPFVLSATRGTVGFQEAEWKKL